MSACCLTYHTHDMRKVQSEGSMHYKKDRLEHHGDSWSKQVSDCFSWGEELVHQICLLKMALGKGIRKDERTKIIPKFICDTTQSIASCFDKIVIKTTQKKRTNHTLCLWLWCVCFVLYSRFVLFFRSLTITLFFSRTMQSDLFIQNKHYIRHRHERHHKKCVLIRRERETKDLKSSQENCENTKMKRNFST